MLVNRLPACTQELLTSLSQIWVLIFPGIKGNHPMTVVAWKLLFFSHFVAADVLLNRLVWKQLSCLRINWFFIYFPTSQKLLWLKKIMEFLLLQCKIICCLCSVFWFNWIFPVNGQGRLRENFSLTEIPIYSNKEVLFFFLIYIQQLFFYLCFDEVQSFSYINIFYCSRKANRDIRPLPN